MAMCKQSERKTRLFVDKMIVGECFNKQNERKLHGYLSKRRTFADANKLRRRVKAAAQHSSSELGSAFALHFTCTV